MNSFPIKNYLLNCFLLTIPIMLWNIFLTEKLPAAFQAEIFWNDIPAFLSYGENISRIAVFALTVLMPLQVSSPVQKGGLVLYLAGTLLYFLSWVILIIYPDSSWSNSLFGFMAPAFTPLIWLVGIGLTGNSYYINLPFRHWHFIAISTLFLLFHNYHTALIYFRTH